MEADLSEPADILAIRIFEYLDSQAAILLIFALIDKAKPNSMFYIETYMDADSDVVDQIGHRIKPGYLTSFFGPRVDIKFTHHSINRESLNHNGALSVNNRLIVQKL